MFSRVLFHKANRWLRQTAPPCAKEQPVLIFACLRGADGLRRAMRTLKPATSVSYAIVINR